MSAPHWLVLVSLCWITFTAVVASLAGIYRSLGGRPITFGGTFDTVGERFVALLIDAFGIVTWCIVLSLAWGAR